MVVVHSYICDKRMRTEVPNFKRKIPIFNLKKIENIFIATLLLCAVIIPFVSARRDYQSLNCSVSTMQFWNEWPGEGAFYGSCVKVDIDSTDPSGSEVAVLIVPPYPPFEPYFEGYLSAGESTGWVDTYGEEAPFYVQINFSGDACYVQAHMHWLWP
jgi:hypothetical protein